MKTLSSLWKKKELENIYSKIQKKKNQRHANLFENIFYI